MSISTIIWFLFVFCIIVISHEFGHFIVAKLNGIHVEEFTIGMGPKIVGFHKNGTYYVLRWLPLGGACIFEGMDPIEAVEGSDDDKESEDEAGADTLVTMENGVNKDSECDGDMPKEEANYGIKFNDAPVWARIATTLAGPFANFVIAFVMAIVVVWFCGSDLPVVHELMEGYPAAESGLEDGDLITEINGSKIYTAREIYVNTFVNKEGKPLTITYERDGEEYTTTIVPQYSEEDDRYLLGLTNYGDYIECNNASVFKYAAIEVRYCLVATLKSLGMLLEGNGSKDDVSGPVGMAHIISDVQKQASPYGFGLVLLNMVNIAMLLSVNLGVMNLLPIPAIDGGRLIFLLIEVVRGKPVPPEKEGIVHLAGFVLLFALMIFVMYNDISNWIG